VGSRLRCRVEFLGTDLPGEAGPVRDQLQQVHVVAGEHAWRTAAHVQDPDQGVPGEHRHTQQRRDALLQQDRAHHVAGPDLGDGDRLADLGHPAGEAAADRHPEPLPHLLLETLGRGRDELTGVHVQHQDRRGVDPEQVPDAFEELVEQLGDGQAGQRRVGDGFEPP
jgi:hypothetical protein